MTRAYRSLILAVTFFGAATVLAGCYSEEQQGPPVVPQKVSLSVKRDALEHTVYFSNRAHLSTLERDRLEAFIADSSGPRLESIHITLSDGTKAEQAEIVRLLERRGVDPRRIRVLPPATVSRHVLVEIARFRAVRAPCHPWDPVWSASHDTSGARPDLGCSDLNNFSAMIADPHDLIEGSTTPYADGTTAAAAVRRFHENKVEPLPPPADFATTGGNNGGTGTQNSNQTTSGGM